VIFYATEFGTSLTFAAIRVDLSLIPSNTNWSVSKPNLKGFFMRYPMWENIFKKPTEDSETVLALKGVPIFQDLEKKRLREIEHLVHHRTYAKGETVFTQGQPGLGMYVILSGSINIIQTDKEDNELTLATLEEGAFFGEMGLLVDAPRSASARASEITEIVAFFRPDLFDLLNR